jgi:hypothetical protein
MVRVFPTLCVVALAGCQVAPPVAPGVARPPETVRLFGREVLTDSESVTQEVKAHVWPGMECAQAVSLLQMSGFECRGTRDVSQLWAPLTPPEVSNEVVHSPFCREHLWDKPLHCVIRKDELSSWGKEYKTVLVLLYPDQEKQHVAEILVFVGTGPNAEYYFFVKHPDLHEPVGLSVEEAQRQLQAVGFKCSKLKDPAGHDCLSCRYYDEWAIGGKIIHVNLFYDDAGIVRDSQIVRDREWLEMERCMLPDSDDATGKFIGKSLLFAVREACLLTAE